MNGGAAHGRFGCQRDMDGGEPVAWKPSRIKGVGARIQPAGAWARVSVPARAAQAGGRDPVALQPCPFRSTTAFGAPSAEIVQSKGHRHGDLGIDRAAGLAGGVEPPLSHGLHRGLIQGAVAAASQDMQPVWRAVGADPDPEHYASLMTPYARDPGIGGRPVAGGRPGRPVRDLTLGGGSGGLSPRGGRVPDAPGSPGGRAWVWLAQLGVRGRCRGGCGAGPRARDEGTAGVPGCLAA